MGRQEAGLVCVVPCGMARQGRDAWAGEEECITSPPPKGALAGGQAHPPLSPRPDSHMLAGRLPAVDHHPYPKP